MKEKKKIRWPNLIRHVLCNENIKFHYLNQKDTHTQNQTLDDFYSEKKKKSKMKDLFEIVIIMA